MNKTVILCRVSSREQEVEGFSLQSQEKLLKGYAKDKNLPIAKIYSISESASGKKQRETFNDMLAFVKKNNIKLIICEKVDRLTRNLRDAVQINEWINGDKDREVHFVKENVVLNSESKSNEKFIWNIKVSVAQYYIDNLSEEVKKGQKEKLEQGWFPARAKLGYKALGDKGKKIQIIDEIKGPLMRKTFELYSSGNYSLGNLTDVVYEMGLRTHDNNRIAKSRLHEFLTDPYYCGKIVWSNKTYQGKHEPLISQELFDRVQMVLRGKTTPKYQTHFFTFRGLVHCEECDGLVTWETHKNIIYGHCNHYRNCTQKTWAKENEIDKQAVEALRGLQIKNSRIMEWLGKALKEHHGQEIEVRTKSLSQLEEQLKQISQRMDRLYDDKLDRKITEEFYDRKFEQYNFEKDKITQAITKAHKMETEYFQLGSLFYDVAQNAVKIYENSTPEYKRQLLKLVFEKLELNEGKLLFEYNKPFKLLFELAKASKSSKVRNLQKIAIYIFEPLKNGNLQVGSTQNRTIRPTWLRE